ncbi:MAG: hypothetical protein AABY93_11910 [Bacteroidota bacterium]
MAYNEKLAGRIRESIAVIPMVEEKFMFGGVCFRLNGKMWGGGERRNDVQNKS